MVCMCRSFMHNAYVALQPSNPWSKAAKSGLAILPKQDGGETGIKMKR